MKRRGHVTRQVPPQTRTATFRSATVDEEKRTIELVWTTGARVLRQPWFGDDYIEELSLDPKHVRMERLRSGAPLLNAHNSYSLDAVIGVVESARLEKAQGVAVVRFPRAEDDPEADAIFRKVKDGIIRNVSVGYRAHHMTRTEAGEGETPVMLVDDWEPYEISMVPIGADAGAGVRSEGAQTNPCDIVAQERAMAKKKPTPSRTETATVRADEADETAGEGAEGTESEDEGDDEAEDDEAGDDAADDAEKKPAEDGARSAAALAVRAERERASAIRRDGARLRVDQALIERHIERGTTVAKFRKIAIRTLGDKSPLATGEGRIDAGEDARDKWLRGAGAALLARAGRAQAVIDAAKLRGESVKVDPGEFRGMSLLDMARESLERAGVKTRGMDKMALAGLAFTHRAGGYQTTSDFATLLAGTLHTSLLAAYATAPDTWRLFAKAGSVSDFRPHTRLRQGAFTRLDKVNEAGEFKNKKILDGAGETIRAETYGNIVGVTRQVIVNDDLGFLSDLSARLGRAAKLSIELMVYDLLAENSGAGPTMADGNPLFHSSHANISTGAALGVAALDADRVKMATQLDPNGVEILDIRPSVLLLPIGLEGQARVMIEAEFDVDEADGVTPNRIRKLFPTIIGTPRLTGTRRYIFADPDVAPTLEVVFLDGQQEPFLDQQDGWRIDGTEWKVRLDVGADAVDYRGAIMNAGA